MGGPARRCCLVAFAAVAWGASCLYAERGPVEPEQVCVISPTAAAARVGNRRVDTLPQGTVFDVDRKQDGWLWSNRYQGWVRSRDVLPLNEAILWFGRELQKHPHNAQLFRSRAAARLHKTIKLQRDVASTALFALGDVNCSLRLNPKDALALCLRGRIHIEIGAADLALKDFNRAIELEPRDELPRLLRAAHLIQQKEYAGADADLKAVLEQNSRSAAAWLARGAWHYAQDDKPAMLEDLKQAIRSNPYCAQAYRLHARLRLDRRDTAGALADSEVALRLDPCDELAWAIHAECLAERGWHHLAVDHYTRAIQLDPNAAGFYVGRGQSHFALSRKESSQDDDKAQAAANASTERQDSGKTHEADVIRLMEHLVEYDSGKWPGKPEFTTAGSPDDAADSKSKDTEKGQKQDNQNAFKVHSSPHATAARADVSEACRLAPDNPEVLARCGMLLSKLSDRDAAILLLDESIALRPEVGWPYGYRGTCHYSQKEYAAAFSDLDLAVAKAPEDANLRNVRARARLFRFDFCGAEDDARMALTLDPQNVEALTSLLCAVMLQGRSQEALDIARNLERFPLGVKYERLAILWFLEGEYDRAERWYARAAAATTGLEWHLFGTNRLWAVEPAKLLTAYEQAVQRHCECRSWPVLRFQADLALRRGRVDEAIERYTDILESTPCNSRLWVRRARAYLRQYDFERAAADIAQALSIDPQCSFALAARAELAIEQGNLNAALDDCHAALRVDSESVEAYVQLARLWRILGDFEQGLSDASTALSLNPYCAEARREQGFAWLALRDEHAAREAFQKCLEIQAADAAAHFGFAEASRGLQHDEIAIQHYDAALARRPEWAAALGGRGMVWLRDGNQARAAADFEAALELDPDDVHALSGRGELRRLRGEYAAAAADLRHALELNPEFGDAAESLAWILSACPDEKLRDGAQAVTLAKHAVRNRPTCNRLQALAAAFAEVGDFAAAEEAEKQALEVAPPFARQEFDDRLALFANHQPVRLEVRESEETETVPVPEPAPDAPFQP